MNAKFIKFKEQQFLSLEILSKENLLTSFLMVYYSTLDICGYISGLKFEGFFTKYMKDELPEVKLADLWGARCGILHTNSPESKHFNEQKARRISYVWGKADIKLIREAIHRKNNSHKDIAIRIEELFHALKVGIEKFELELKSNQKLYDSVSLRIDKTFEHITLKDIEKHLESN